MSWITRVLHSNHCHQWLKPTYTMTTSGAGHKLGRGGLFVLGNWVLCWCDDRTLRAIEQDGLLLSVQILDNQPFAVRDHVN